MVEAEPLPGVGAVLSLHEADSDNAVLVTRLLAVRDYGRAHNAHAYLRLEDVQQQRVSVGMVLRLLEDLPDTP